MMIIIITIMRKVNNACLPYSILLVERYIGRCDHYFWLANNYSKGNEIVDQQRWWIVATVYLWPKHVVPSQNTRHALPCLRACLHVRQNVACDNNMAGRATYSAAVNQLAFGSAIARNSFCRRCKLQRRRQLFYITNVLTVVCLSVAHVLWLNGTAYRKTVW